MGVQRFARCAAGIAFLALVWSPSAHAYIDGATASMIFQMLIAGGLAATLTLKIFWGNLKTWVASFGKKSPPMDEKQ